MEWMKGVPVAAAITARVADTIKKTGMRPPHLAIVRAGCRPDDVAYERGASKRMEKAGIRCSVCALEETVSQEEFLKVFDALNGDDDVDGLLVLRPLPPQLDASAIEERIDPKKDVDGISPVNMARVYAGRRDGFAPCTAEAVMEILRFFDVDPAGKRAVVVGRSLVIGKPLSMLLLREHATVTTCHTWTADLPTVCRTGEILVAAAGQARLIDDRYVGDGAVVIDVGIHVEEDGGMCGDVDVESISHKASLATPVPGGVGAVTTSVLASHVLQAAMARRGMSPEDIRREE